MDFSKMKYRVDLIPDNKNVTDIYPIFARIPLLVSPLRLPEGLTADFVLRYILLLFGQGSPFIEEITDLTKRKSAVLKFLKVQTNEKNEYPESIVKMMSYSNESVLHRVVTVLRLCRSEDWSLAMACEQKHYDLIAQKFLPREDIKDEKTLSEAINLNLESLVSSREKVLAGENARIVQEAVMQFLADENLGIRPEEYMDVFEVKKTVFPEVIP